MYIPLLLSKPFQQWRTGGGGYGDICPQMHPKQLRIFFVVIVACQLISTGCGDLFISSFIFFVDDCPAQYQNCPHLLPPPPKKKQVLVPPLHFSRSRKQSRIHFVDFDWGHRINKLILIQFPFKRKIFGEINTF